MINIVQKGSVYDISFKYDPELISIVKAIPCRVWDPVERVWSIPVNRLGWFLDRLRGTRYANQVNIQSSEHLNENDTIDATDATQIPDIDISDVDLYVQDGYKLYSHQLDFLRYAKSRSGRGFLLADEMGLGKTLEVMNYALYQRKVHGYQHCLIICCVNSSKFSWQDDIWKHSNGTEHAYILGTRKKRGGSIRYTTSGADKLKDLQTGHMYGDTSAPKLPYFLILNIEALRMISNREYRIAEKLINLIVRREIRMIAIDEIHKNASPKSIQGKLLLKIKSKTGKAAEWIPMTGSPIVSKPTDLYTPLRLIDAHNFKSFYMWCDYFVISGGYGTNNVIGYKNIPYLKNMLQHNMIRRLKSDVLDLPDKIYFNEYVENTSRQIQMYANVRRHIEDNREDIISSFSPLSEFLKLRQVNGSPELIDKEIQIDNKYPSINAKLTRTLELVAEIVERGEKVVIFSNWVAPLKTLYRFIAKQYKTACYTGTMTEEERQKHKRVFINNPEYKVMIGTIGALGVNHTLTVANNIIFYDEPWTATDKKQAEDRCHRISMDKPLNIYTLLSKDTIDEYVHKIVYRKQDIADFMIDDKLDLRNKPELFDMLLGHDK